MLDRFLSVASVLGTRHFGVILRVDVPAHADGQNHPEQLKPNTTLKTLNIKHIFTVFYLPCSLKCATSPIEHLIMTFLN